MIRRLAILVLIACVAVFAAWKFYVNAIAYDPLDEGAVKHAQIKEGTLMKSTYAPAWSSEIHEKNLFSPTRSFLEPKPVSVMAPVEPPKRPELALKGIVLDTFGEYVAYVEINQAKAAPLRKGDKVEEIEVADITDKKLVLKWYTETITLTIEKVKTISRSNAPRMGK
jgi:hypothetical protein